MDGWFTGGRMHLTEEARVVGRAIASDMPVPLRLAPGIQVTNLVVVGMLPGRGPAALRAALVARRTSRRSAPPSLAVRRSHVVVPDRIRLGGNRGLHDLVIATERARVSGVAARWTSPRPYDPDPLRRRHRPEPLHAVQPVRSASRPSRIVWFLNDKLIARHPLRRLGVHRPAGRRAGCGCWRPRWSPTQPAPRCFRRRCRSTATADLLDFLADSRGIRGRAGRPPRRDTVRTAAPGTPVPSRLTRVMISCRRLVALQVQPGRGAPPAPPRHRAS